MLAEAIALSSLPFINIRTLLKKYEGLRAVLGGLCVLLMAQMISDLANQSSAHDFLRGWAVIIFCMVSTIFLVYHISKTQNGILYLLFALFLVRLIFGEGALDPQIMDVNTNYFKMRFVGFLDPAILLISYYLYKIEKKWLTTILFFVFGLICMTFDARSNGLIYIVSSLLIYIKGARIKFSKGKIVSLAVFVSTLLYLGYVYYVNQVLYHGLGGHNAITQLKKASNPYNPFDLLFYGRKEVPVLIIAGLDKPIFGHGSWGKDPSRKYAKLSEVLTNSNTIGQESYIRAHSIIFGYWAYAGIFGLISVLYLFFRVVGYIAKIYLNKYYDFTMLPILIVLCINMTWNFFFSPIGHLRTSFPLVASLAITEYAKLNVSNSRLRARKRKRMIWRNY